MRGRSILVVQTAFVGDVVLTTAPTWMGMPAGGINLPVTS